MSIFKRPVSIRARLTLTYTLVLTIVLIAFGAVAFRILKSRLNSSLSRELIERAAALRGYLRFEDGEVSLNFDPNDPEQAYFVEASTRFYQIYDLDDGRLLAQSPELNLLGLELTPEEVRVMANSEPFYDVQTDEGPLRFRNEILRLPPGHQYLFQIGATMRPNEAALGHFFELLLWLIPTAVGLACIAGWWATARALQPVVTLASDVQQMTVADLTRRLPVRGTGDELDQLAGAFNKMFERLGRTIDEMKQFTASVSHELRTPLAILRGEAEVALMQAGDNIEDLRRVMSSQLEEFDKLTRMINQLLTLARAEAGEIAIDRKAVDLCALGRSLAEQMIPVAESKGIQLMTECRRDFVMIDGDASWLERLILNLLDNAMKFTRAGGRVTVAVDESAGGGVLEVRDTGVGISSEALPHIFERFYQADPSRSVTSGVGLGLSLVKWIVDQHHGTIRVSTQPGEGTIFYITLPLIKNS